MDKCAKNTILVICFCNISGLLETKMKWLGFEVKRSAFQHDQIC